MKLTVIGAGGWGTALAIQAAKRHEVTLWSYSREEAELFRQKRENVYYLPGVGIPDTIGIESDPEAVRGSGIVLFVVPSKFFRGVAKIFAPLLPAGTVAVSATKGFEYSTEKRMSEILSEELDDPRVVVLSGPSHAEEVARETPTSIAAASRDEDAAVRVQEALSNESLRIYTNDDVAGVEVCGAVKNVIAVAAGMLRGFGFGDNTMAALVTRGLAEMRRLGMRLGAKLDTFAGLAGMGDLVVTCFSRHSRNGKFGEELARGRKAEEILAGMKMVAEGVETVKTVVRLESELDVPMPISHAVSDVIYGGADPLTALKALMTRPLKSETL